MLHQDRQPLGLEQARRPLEPHHHLRGQQRAEAGANGNKVHVHIDLLVQQHQAYQEDVQRPAREAHVAVVDEVDVGRVERLVEEGDARVGEDDDGEGGGDAPEGAELEIEELLVCEVRRGFVRGRVGVAVDEPEDAGGEGDEGAEEGDVQAAKRLVRAGVGMREVTYDIQHMARQPLCLIAGMYLMLLSLVK